MPGKIRKRLEADLASDFSARLEHGETDGEIIRSMGAPEKLAAEFIAENDPGAADRVPAKRGFLAFGILFAVLAAALGIRLAALSGLGGRIRIWLSEKEAAAAGQTIIGGADGPTSIFVTVRPNPWMYVLFVGLLAAFAVCLILYARSRRNWK
jgi:uncharacterized membrane protein